MRASASSASSSPSSASSRSTRITAGSDRPCTTSVASTTAKAKKTISSRPGSGAPASVCERDQQRRGDRDGAAHPGPGDERRVVHGGDGSRSRSRAGQQPRQVRDGEHPDDPDQRPRRARSRPPRVTSDQPSSGIASRIGGSCRPMRPNRSALRRKSARPRIRRPAGASPPSSARACASRRRRRP